jgi:hypothetical protein
MQYVVDRATLKKRSPLEEEEEEEVVLATIIKGGM